MAIRNSAKAIIVKDDRILLNRCYSRLGEYYALPGGGQNPGETLTEAIVREVLEETGFTVEPLRLAGVYEHITPGRGTGTDHKLYFIFVCKLVDVPQQKPTERDSYQLGVNWLPIEEIDYSRLFPQKIRENVLMMLQGKETSFLGSERKR